MARQRVATNTWHEKKWWAKCRVTRRHNKVAMAKKTEMVKRSARANSKMKGLKERLGWGVKIAWCGVHAKIDTWVIHHP